MNATPALRQADVPTLAHWIGGKRTPGTSGRVGDVWTPATGALGARVPFATGAEVARAVESLGELVTGQKQGRVSTDGLTVFKSVGLAIQDSSVAKAVFNKIRGKEPLNS